MTTTTIGTLCRFTGYAPLTACPEEAPNGCVDREGCSRTCDEDGYFNWRCKGPQLVTAGSVDNTADDTVADSANDNAAAVSALADQLENALVNQDYSYLARVIMEKGGSSAAAAFSAAAKHTSNFAQKAAAAKQARNVAVAMQKRAAPTTLLQKPKNVLVPSYKPAEDSSAKAPVANAPAAPSKAKDVKAKDVKKTENPKAEPMKKEEAPKAKPVKDALPAPPMRLNIPSTKSAKPMTEEMKRLLGKVNHLRS